VELTDELLDDFDELSADAGLVPTNISEPMATNAMIILANLRIPAPKAGKLLPLFWWNNLAISSQKIGFG
jgi:hypothetical protein